MSNKLKKLIENAIIKLACDGDSEALLLALNLENELCNNKTFIEMMEGE